MQGIHKSEADFYERVFWGELVWKVTVQDQK